ncbi:hypothetical protein ADUPG1_013831 [Aduncisulcus paluster]|uniref:Uncharacterized protein n=1 Tax=Aduncisulcus paluster TaxID=2918883 RepID=A0ABQ5K4C6_9EUKA|nr:hypothetical protein ADUPG1_013831 [Aduncisulcus paluster]
MRIPFKSSISYEYHNFSEVRLVGRGPFSLHYVAVLNACDGFPAIKCFIKIFPHLKKASIDTIDQVSFFEKFVEILREPNLSYLQTPSKPDETKQSESKPKKIAFDPQAKKSTPSKPSLLSNYQNIDDSAQDVLLDIKPFIIPPLGLYNGLNPNGNRKYSFGVVYPFLQPLSRPTLLEMGKSYKKETDFDDKKDFSLSSSFVTLITRDIFDIFSNVNKTGLFDDLSIHYNDLLVLPGTSSIKYDFSFSPIFLNESVPLLSPSKFVSSFQFSSILNIYSSYEKTRKQMMISKTSGEKFISKKLLCDQIFQDVYTEDSSVIFSYLSTLNVPPPNIDHLFAIYRALMKSISVRCPFKMTDRQIGATCNLEMKRYIKTNILRSHLFVHDVSILYSALYLSLRLSFVVFGIDMGVIELYNWTSKVYKELAFAQREKGLSQSFSVSFLLYATLFEHFCHVKELSSGGLLDMEHSFSNSQDFFSHVLNTTSIQSQTYSLNVLANFTKDLSEISVAMPLSSTYSIPDLTRLAYSLSSGSKIDPDILKKLIQTESPIEILHALPLISHPYDIKAVMNRGIELLPLVEWVKTPNWRARSLVRNGLHIYMKDLLEKSIMGDEQLADSGEESVSKVSFAPMDELSPRDRQEEEAWISIFTFLSHALNLNDTFLDKHSGELSVLAPQLLRLAHQCKSGDAVIYALDIWVRVMDITDNGLSVQKHIQDEFGVDWRLGVPKKSRTSVSRMLLEFEDKTRSPEYFHSSPFYPPSHMRIRKYPSKSDTMLTPLLSFPIAFRNFLYFLFHRAQYPRINRSLRQSIFISDVSPFPCSSIFAMLTLNNGYNFVIPIFGEFQLPGSPMNFKWDGIMLGTGVTLDNTAVTPIEVGGSSIWSRKKYIMPKKIKETSDSSPTSSHDSPSEPYDGNKIIPIPSFASPSFYSYFFFVQSFVSSWFCDFLVDFETEMLARDIASNPGSKNRIRMHTLLNQCILTERVRGEELWMASERKWANKVKLWANHEGLASEVPLTPSKSSDGAKSVHEHLMAEDDFIPIDFTLGDHEDKPESGLYRIPRECYHVPKGISSDNFKETKPSPEQEKEEEEEEERRRERGRKYT